MGCGCLKPTSLNNDKNFSFNVPCNIIEEPSVNNEKKEKPGENNENKDLISNSSKKNKNNNFISGKIKNNSLCLSSCILEESKTREKTYNNPIFECCSTLNIYSSNAFALEMLREINLIRTNPIAYASKIKEFIKFIYTDEKNNRKYILVNKNTKLNLLKGEEAFLNCLDFITELDKNLKSQKTFLHEFELKDELKFPFPLDEPDKCISNEYIKENFVKLKLSLGFRFKLKGFHYDLSTNDPEISTLLQIVDDNNSSGKRRNMLLDENVKYVGINIGKLKDNIFCIYLVFAS